MQRIPGAAQTKSPGDLTNRTAPLNQGSVTSKPANWMRIRCKSVKLPGSQRARRAQPPCTSFIFPFTPICLILSSSLLASERLPISLR